MSSFRLSARHLAAMVDGFIGSAVGACPQTMLNPHTGERFSVARREILETLEATNIDSLHARYPGQLSASVLYTEFPEVSPMELKQLGGVVGLYKAIDCYEYQSCEHSGWLASNARVFCANMRARLARDLPGYDDAPTWGI